MLSFLFTYADKRSLFIPRVPYRTEIVTFFRIQAVENVCYMLEVDASGKY